MTLSIKSNGKQKKLLEESDAVKQVLYGDHTVIRRCLRWSRISVNAAISLPGGQAMTKIAQLPATCNHPEANMGVFPILTAEWMPADRSAYVLLKSDGGVYARSMSACSGVLYFDFITNDLEIVGGGVLNLLRNLGLYLRKYFALLTV